MRFLDQAKFEDVKTGIGVVATKWVRERPMIFKDKVEQAHGCKATFYTRLWSQCR